MNPSRLWQSSATRALAYNHTHTHSQTESQDMHHQHPYEMGKKLCGNIICMEIKATLLEAIKVYH